MTRESLALQQGELLRALLAGGQPPAGFDPERIAAQTRALLAKRRRVVAMIRPDLAEALGDRFALTFTAYAVDHPRLAGSRAREDAEAFGTWLVDQGELAAPRRSWWRRAR
ncbi:hypothetical protein GCM10010174_82660 [Kutzneria viridogrisea]|uniref:SCO6045-like C-terminal domain-containing protein n=2 Tax=Kutzneria TaxID=43356 RepID=W5WH55_9PSEU|nr:hypothetical protein [Kutzneria albida]AHI00158.1 hypothetical protein KALB_6799 [Kutzneria albida DSM 43870]MBA8925334.1 hypothetical protein [Kutzneria viridogrisea]